jgi:hypothetical protein
MVSHQLLELAVLFLQQAQTPGIFDFQAAKLLLPLVVSGRTDAVAAA